MQPKYTGPDFFGGHVGVVGGGGWKGDGDGEGDRQNTHSANHKAVRYWCLRANQILNSLFWAGVSIRVLES